MRTHKEQNGAPNHTTHPYIAKDMTGSRSVSPYLPDPSRLRDWTKPEPEEAKLYARQLAGTKIY